MARRRVRPQVARKRSDGRCALCPQDAYEALEAHRIVPGASYTRANLVSLCGSCHLKVHAGTLVIHGRLDSTAGPVLKVTLGGETFYLFEETGARHPCTV